MRRGGEEGGEKRGRRGRGDPKKLCQKWIVEMYRKRPSSEAEWDGALVRGCAVGCSAERSFPATVKRKIVMCENASESRMLFIESST